jgi:UDP-3-O-[3-hydroxymyristoyl] glucosamine N-acyltransferase
MDALEILRTLEHSRVIGDVRKEINGYASILEAGPADLTFCNLEGRQAVSLLKRTRAGLVLIHESVPNAEQLKSDACFILTKNPRLNFVRCLNTFFPQDVNWGIHPTAVIGKGVILAKTVFVGPHAVLGDAVKIGAHTIIGANVLVSDNCRIGKEVKIQAGAIIGCEGQGFERNNEGRLESFPQTGKVVLSDWVEIGSNATIVRGTLPKTDTFVGEGTKIGHLVDIGHNVTIGEHCFISAGVVVCGSAKIEDYAWIAPGCTIRQKVKIGRNATVGLGSVVLSDVADAMTVAGVPAKPF